MSVKTTHELSRETAISILESKLYDASDEELEEMLEALKESTYRNYSIVDGKLSGFKIDSAGDF